MPHTTRFFVMLAVLANGCSAAHLDQAVSQAGLYYQRAERGVTGALARAADALGFRRRPAIEPMYARANVNVRSGPGTGHDAIGAVPAGATVAVVQEKDGWYWIRYGTGHGWVNATYFLAGTPAAATQTAASSMPRQVARQAPSEPQFVEVVPHASEESVLAAERPTTAGASIAPSATMAQAQSQAATALSSEASSEAQAVALMDAPTTTIGRLELETPPPTLGQSASTLGPEADQTDTLPTDPASVPGDASASAAPPQASDEAEETSQLASAAALGGDVEVAGITFQWGMSPTAAATRYGDRARRVETNGAVWLRAASVGAGVDVPVEWFDLRYCGRRLCAIHHVINDVEGQQKIGDEIAATFAGQHGKATADFWTDFGYGRLRMRTWRTPSTRVRLSHQEAQTYVAIDYEPIGVSRPPLQGTGQIAREDQATTTTNPQ